MPRATLFFILPLVLSVTAQNGLRRPRPTPVLGRTRLIKPFSEESGTKPEPAVAELPEEEFITYDPEPGLEPETATEFEPELEPAVGVESGQPVSELSDQPQPNLAPQNKAEEETASVMAITHKPYSYLLKTHPQGYFAAAPMSVSKPVTVKPTPLPPLLPRTQPVRESVFGRQTAPTTQEPMILSTQHETKSRLGNVISPTAQKVGSILDSVCIDGNGYYAVPNECDSYIECKYYKATQHWCSDGLHFNPAAKRYEYPCSYPSIAMCTSGTERQNPHPTAQCPRQNGFYSTNDGDCTKYIVCQNGEATVMSCPFGLVFNPTVQGCDWVENVPQCNPDVFKDYVCPEPPIGEDGLVSDIIYRYRYEQHCKLYIACHRGYPRLLSCELGLSFHEDSQSCIEEEYVLDCAHPII